MGIDTANAVSLRRGEAAASELAEIPDTIELRAADEAIARSERSDGTERAHQVREKIERMAEQYRDGEAPAGSSEREPRPATGILRCCRDGSVGIRCQVSRPSTRAGRLRILPIARA
jgi:hypothetical protein